MRLSQIIDQGRYRNIVGTAVHTRESLGHEVNDYQKRLTIDIIHFADFFHRFVTKPQRQSKPAHNL